MSRLRQSLGAILAGTLIVATGTMATAQDSATPDTATPDTAVRAQMASITLDSAGVPGGYVLAGETFLGADSLATGDITADELAGAGFISQYVSTYLNPDTGYEITSYASAWTDADAAGAGFAILEDESRTHPDGTFEDGDAGVGETPGETSTGTYPDPADGSVTVSTVDVTYRVDRFLVGTSLSTRDGSAPDAATVSSLAGAVEGRATAAVGNQNPDGTDLALVPQVLPLAGLGAELQAGFLGTGDVEQMYGVTGSALSSFDASWTEAIGLGSGDTLQPFVAVGVTSFATADDAAAVLDQVSDLAPQVPNATSVDGVEIDGASGVAAYSFPSEADTATDPNSFRIIAVVNTALIVVDVQDAPSAEIAQNAATQLASAQAGCIGQASCAAPALPGDLTAQ